MFYTYVDDMSNRIYHRFIDNDNNRQQEVISEFPFSLWLKTTKESSDGMSLFNDPLKEKKLSNIHKLKKFIEEQEDINLIFGQTSISHQFISKQYTSDILFNSKQLVTVIIDIENKFENEFPNPSLAKEEITVITLKILDGNSYFPLGNIFTFSCIPDYVSKYKNAEYVYSYTEEELLTNFLNYWKRISPDIITGWNVIGYDIPYLINRMTKILGPNKTTQLSPFYKNTKNVFKEVSIRNSDQKSYSILGITVFDYLELYKKFSLTTREKYTLDHIAQVELNESKLDYSEYDNLMELFHKDPIRYVDYNIKDVLLIERLDKKLNFLQIAYTLAYLGKIKLKEIYSPVRFWDNYIYVKLLEKDIQIPPYKNSNNETQIEGAFVKEPIPGLYNWIVSVDLTSLYPSIIMLLNLSPETLRSKASGNYVDSYVNMNEDLSSLKKMNRSIAANGATFTREYIGVMPTLVESMFSERKRYKKQMLNTMSSIEKYKSEIELKYNKHFHEIELTKEQHDELNQLTSIAASFEAMQQALKISLNSLYGAQANPYFRYFSTDIAEGITLTGQLAIQYISKHINIFMNGRFDINDKDCIVMNDTDSAYITLEDFVNTLQETDINKITDKINQFCQTELEPFISEKYKELESYLNAMSSRLHMKRESICNRILIIAKKHYVLQIIDNEGVRYTEPKIKAVGIEVARSSTPLVIRNALKKTLDIMLNKDETALQEFIKDFRQEFMNLELNDISFPTGVSDIEKWKDSNDSWISRTPIHVKAAITYNNLLLKHKLNTKYPLIRNGDKIKYIYLKQPNPMRSTAIAFISQLHKEFNIEQYIDRETQLQKTFIDPVKSFTDILNWNIKKTLQLDTLFSFDIEQKEKETALYIPQSSKSVKKAKRTLLFE